MSNSKITSVAGHSQSCAVRYVTQSNEARRRQKLVCQDKYAGRVQDKSTIDCRGRPKSLRRRIKKHKRRNTVGGNLLDVVAVAVPLPADPSLPADFTPAPRAFLDSNGFLGRPRMVGRAHRLVAMDAYEMSAQVVLAAERSAARCVRADMGLETIGIMRSHMGLQIICAGKCSWARAAFVLFACVILGLIVNSPKGARVRHRRDDGRQMRVHVRGRDRGLRASPIGQRIIIGGSGAVDSAVARTTVIREA